MKKTQNKTKIIQWKLFRVLVNNEKHISFSSLPNMVSFGNKSIEGNERSGHIATFFNKKSS